MVSGLGLDLDGFILQGRGGCGDSSRCGGGGLGCGVLRARFWESVLRLVVVSFRALRGFYTTAYRRRPCSIKLETGNLQLMPGDESTAYLW